MYELSEKTGFNFDFSQYLKERRDRLEDSLSLYLDGTLPETLWQSMRYSVLSGGKRLRAILSMAGAEAVVLHQHRQRAAQQRPRAGLHQAHAEVGGLRARRDRRPRGLSIPKRPHEAPVTTRAQTLTCPMGPDRAGSTRQR